MLVPDKTLFVNPDFPRKLAVVPIGATIRLHVNFYNSLGVKFDVVHLKPQLRFNRYGLLGYSWTSSESGHQTLVLTALKEGTTIIRVWVEASQNQEMSDYIQINVGQVIHPKEADLAVGDVVCFSSPLTSPEGQAGTWSEDTSGDTGVFHFFPGTPGVAIAQKPGTVKVRQDVSSFVTTSNSMVVQANQGIFLDARNIPYLTNWADEEVQLPMVVAQSPDTPFQSSKRIMSVGCSKQELGSLASPFECSLRFTEGETLLKGQEVFICRVVFSPEANEYRVSLKTNKQLSSEKQHFVAGLRSKLQINVKLSGSKVPSIPVSFQFLPAFYVHDREILLTNQEPLQYIILTGISSVLKDIQAAPVNEETKRLLDVFPPEFLRDSSGDITGVQIPMQLKGKLDSLWQTTHHGLGVKVVSPMSRQQEVVSIGVKWNFQEGSQCIKLSRSSLYDNRKSWDVVLDVVSGPFLFVINNFQTFVTIGCLILVGVVTFLYWSRSRPCPVNPNFVSGFHHQPTFQASNSPNKSLLLSQQQVTSSPFGNTSFASPTSPFGRSFNVSSANTPTRRILDTSSLASTTITRVSSDPDLISAVKSSKSSTSPKGIIGRPLWSQPH